MNNYYNYARLELSHQLERVHAASSGDCSTEHSRFAAVALPCRFWWKLAFTLFYCCQVHVPRMEGCARPVTITADSEFLHRTVASHVVYVVALALQSCDS